MPRRYPELETEVERVLSETLRRRPKGALMLGPSVLALAGAVLIHGLLIYSASTRSQSKIPPVLHGATNQSVTISQGIHFPPPPALSTRSALDTDINVGGPAAELDTLAARIDADVQRRLAAQIPDTRAF